MRRRARPDAAIRDAACRKDGGCGGVDAEPGRAAADPEIGQVAGPRLMPTDASGFRSQPARGAVAGTRSSSEPVAFRASRAAWLHPKQTVVVCF